MSSKERQEFLTWYNQLKNEDFLFDFEKEIEEYCRSDVDILRRCCLKFKELMETTCGLHPFKYCVTIACACNRVFRQQFLREEPIGLIPPQGYQPARKYSVMAFKWLSWVYHQTGNRIQHALNGGSHYHCSLIPCLLLHVESSGLFIRHILLLSFFSVVLN